MCERTSAGITFGNGKRVETCTEAAARRYEREWSLTGCRGSDGEDGLEDECELEVSYDLYLG